MWAVHLPANGDWLRDGHARKVRPMRWHPETLAGTTEKGELFPWGLLTWELPTAADSQLASTREKEQNRGKQRSKEHRALFGDIWAPKSSCAWNVKSPWTSQFCEPINPLFLLNLFEWSKLTQSWDQGPRLAILGVCHDDQSVSSPQECSLPRCPTIQVISSGTFHGNELLPGVKGNPKPN